MRAVAFVGFDPFDKVFASEAELRDRVDEVWTLNDFYLVYPDWRFDRVFQIHASEPVSMTANRWLGEWRHEYNSRKLLTVTSRWLDGVDRQDVRNFDNAASEKGGGYYSSSFAYMLDVAMDCGFDSVEMFGMRMRGDGWRKLERAMQLCNIKECGMVVRNPHMAEWEHTTPDLDWRKFRHWKPYHLITGPRSKEDANAMLAALI
jgi:AraC-like DNA-binding protein